jgi:hypothetical protein
MLRAKIQQRPAICNGYDGLKNPLFRLTFLLLHVGEYQHCEAQDQVPSTALVSCNYCFLKHSR